MPFARVILVMSWEQWALPDSLLSKSRPRYLIAGQGTIKCPLNLTFMSLTGRLLGLRKTISSILVLFKLIRQVTGTVPLLRCSTALTRTLRHGCDVIGQSIK